MSKNFKHTKSIVEAVSIKGTLSNDCKTVTVEEKDDDRIVNIKDELENFAGDYVEITIKTKSDEDLDAE